MNLWQLARKGVPFKVGPAGMQYVENDCLYDPEANVVIFSAELKAILETTREGHLADRMRSITPVEFPFYRVMRESAVWN